MVWRRGGGGGGRRRTSNNGHHGRAWAPRANREIYVELCIYEHRDAYLHTELIRVIVVIFRADEGSIIVALLRGKHVSPGCFAH